MVYGANPPPNSAWQIGKTAASVLFVGESENYVLQCKNQSDIAKLQDAIGKIKAGTLVLSDWLTPEEWLKNNP